MTAPPTGVVTFLLTDIEGSSRRWESAAAEMAAALSWHDAVIARHVLANRGLLVKAKGEGDSTFSVFGRATDAVAAAVAVQQEFVRAGPDLHVRMALHTGEAELRDGDYFGVAVNRCARLRGVAHGGQVLLSAAARDLVADHLPAGVDLRDLGEHRLRDLARPEHAFQLVHPSLPSEFPPLRSLDQNPTNLPSDVTSFVGREKEQGQIREIMSQARVVTLTGPGGSGKTRLAVRMAADLIARFPDGVWFVPLAGLADVDRLLPTIAQTLSLREGRGQTYTDVLYEFLGSRTLLLVLDNVEHLLPPAATTIAELVAQAPNLRILVTSREALRIEAEREYVLPPLPSADASTLFTDRAAAHGVDLQRQADNAVIQAICEHLDHLPLALELAAARLKVLPPQALLARLKDRLPFLIGGARDAPERQQTMRATIAWSHELLHDDERQLFARLSAFTGGCRLEAAEQVCGADLNRLASLVDKSLLRRSDERYSMLETVREFAAERLRESADGREVANSHAEYFLASAISAAPEFRGGDQRYWLGRIEEDQDNFRSALRWFLDEGDPERALRLAHALILFWYTRGYVREGREWLLAALQRTQATPSETRAYALDWAGFFSIELGEEVGPLITQALDCARAARASAAEALALCHSRMAAYSLTVPMDEAISEMEQACEIARAAGDPFVLGITLNNLAVAMAVQGASEKALAFAEEGCHIREAMKDHPRVALSLGNMAAFAADLGDLDGARMYATRALAIAQEVGDRRGSAQAMVELSWLAVAAGRFEEAREGFSEAFAIAWQIVSASVGFAAILGLAAVAAASGDRLEAARLAAAGDRELKHPTWGMTKAQRSLLENHLAQARSGGVPEEWDEAWATGAALSFAQLAGEIVIRAPQPKSDGDRGFC